VLSQRSSQWIVTTDRINVAQTRLYLNSTGTTLGFHYSWLLPALPNQTAPGGTVSYKTGLQSCTGAPNAYFVAQDGFSGRSSSHVSVCVLPASPSTAVQRHWQLINEGSYAQAYALFSPQHMHQVSEQGWVADKQRDRPTASTIQIGHVTVAGNVATVPVSFTTRGSETGPGNTGCNAWRGTYTLIPGAGGGWQIDGINLRRTSLTC
jgi:hypothetical protein